MKHIDKFSFGFFIVFIAFIFGCQATGTTSSNLVGGMDKQGITANFPSPNKETNHIEVTAIKKLFDGLEKSWNNKDVKLYLGYWVDGAKIITHRGKTFTIKKNADITGTLNRMREEWRTYKIEKIIKIENDAAAISINFECTKGRLKMYYDLVKQNGQWLIIKQDAS